LNESGFDAPVIIIMLILGAVIVVLYRRNNTLDAFIRSQLVDMSGVMKMVTQNTQKLSETMEELKISIVELKGKIK